MKLQQLVIRNFRGLNGPENKIDFSNSNIIFLIGQNNVGKSSFLRAYEFFVNAKQKAARADFCNHDVNNAIEIEGIFMKEADDSEDPELTGTGKKAEPDWVDKWVDAENRIRIIKRWLSVDQEAERFTWSPDKQDWIVNGFGGMATLFQKYAPTPITISAMETETTLEDKVNKLIQEDLLKRLREDYPDDFNNLLAGIKVLQQKIVGSDIVESYNNDINEEFQKVFANLTLRINPKNDDNIKLEEAFKKNHSVQVMRDGIDREEVFTRYGHGVIRQALYNFLSFLKKERIGTHKEYLILYEEPELFLHPEIAFRLRKSLYDLAESSPFQILCATHSPLMIDISKPHSSLVRVIKNPDETTECHQVGDNVFRSSEEKKSRIQMINRFNPHVCESFYASKVIIVEGDTEAIVFRDLLGRYFNQFEVYVLNAGSKNNIPFFQEIFTAFHIEHCVIHDSDTRRNESGSANSAWTLNTAIWTKIEEANRKRAGLAIRYVHSSNFETAHGVDLTGKDKPIRAYDFVTELTLESDSPCLNFLKDLFGARQILHDAAFIESLN